MSRWTFCYKVCRPGFLVAAVAWIRAGVADGHFGIVLILTYAITLGGTGLFALLAHAQARQEF